ncbi:MAG: asparaginase [Bacteroidia bacterium]|nr:asparaginase [Bacteroidia bacterium]
MGMKIIRVNTAAPHPPHRSLLIIYTGGTLGMVYDKTGKHLIPFDFEHILHQLPELRQFEYQLTVISLPRIMDSSDMQPSHWIQIANIIRDEYAHHDGFVILHGTDTMAYTASALSYLLEGLNKPVIMTGAQLPVGSVRTDAHRNLVSSIQIAAAYEQDRPLVPEVCIFFNDLLLRGNRSKKVESTYFNAYQSENYPPLAKVGIHIDYNPGAMLPYRPEAQLSVQQELYLDVMVIKLFPGLRESLLRCVLSADHLRGVVLETYGSGNAPGDAWFMQCLRDAIERGVMVYNVSQCIGGKVEQGRYANSQALEELGIISGRDISSEAAITKMMYLLAQPLNGPALRHRLEQSLRGEINEA